MSPVVRKGTGGGGAAVATPAADETNLNVAGMDPDMFAQGGLKDDFDGRILKARLVPWDYNGNLDHHILAVALTIKDDEDDEPFVQHYSAGDLEHFVPSKDGKTPVDLENGEGDALEGIYALRVGKREQLSGSSNWAFFVGALLEANFPREALKAAVSFVEGTYGHFNRVPQKKRSGIVAQAPKEGQRARNQDILVMTEVKEAPGVPAAPAAKAAPAKAVAAKPAAKAAKAAPVEEVVEEAAEVDPLTAKATEIIKTAVRAAGDDGLAKGKLPPVILKSFTGADKAKALKLIGDAAFLSESEEWVYDPDSGTLYAAE